MKKATLPVALMAVLLLVDTTQATLIDRGNGLVFDNRQGLEALRANLRSTLGDNT